MITDILLGQPFLKSVTSSLNPSTPPEEEGKVTFKDSNIARIDVDDLTRDALGKAEGIKNMKEWYDARKGQKEIVVDKVREGVNEFKEFMGIIYLHEGVEEGD